MDDVQREAERTGEPDRVGTDAVGPDRVGPDAVDLDAVEVDSVEWGAAVAEAVEEESAEAGGTPEPAISRTPTAEFRVPPRTEPDAAEEPEPAVEEAEPAAEDAEPVSATAQAAAEEAETAPDQEESTLGRAQAAAEEPQAAVEEPQAAVEEPQDQPEDPEAAEEAQEVEEENSSLTRPDIALPRKPRPAPPAPPEPKPEPEPEPESKPEPKPEPKPEDAAPGPADSGPAPRPSPNPTIVDRMPVVKPARLRPPEQDETAEGPEEAGEPAPPAAPSPARTFVDRPRPLRPSPEDQVWDVRAPAESAHVAPPRPSRPVRLPEDEVWDVPAPQESAPPDTRSSGAWAVPWEGGAPIAQAPLPMPVDVEPRKKRRWPLVTLLMVLVLLVGAVTGQLLRPLPKPTVELTLSASSHTFAGTAPTLPWTGQGQSVVYVDGLGLMGSSGGAAPTPTASVAKVMTAYVYLKNHPLPSGQPGPVLTVSPQAAAQIPARQRRGESLLGVTAGQRLTQRKALEALMIISANDVAHELARWDSGSGAAFVAKMNAAAKALGMNATRYTDPSGYDSGTVSTAADQVKLLRAAMRLPAFEEIVNQRSYVPDDGGPARPGGNILVGRHGVVGGKTGYTDAAGGNYVFAARTDVSGVPTLILGAIMGQRSPSAMAAVTAGQQLVTAAEGALTATTLAPAGARVARVEDGLGGRTPLRAASAVTVVGWPGLTVPVRVLGEPPAEGAAGERIATVRAGVARVPLELDRTLGEPDLVKRLTRLR